VNAARHAIYFAPEVGSEWWRFGAGWLGRDESRDAPLPQPLPAGFHADAFAAATAEPHRYGFHATLKAPFRLRADADEERLRRRLAALAATLRAVPLPPLKPVLLENFVALVPSAPAPALVALAARCVLDLDDLRAPLTHEELARRHPERLDGRSRELLEHHGYPHVLERFRFHMTLSGPVDPQLAERLMAAAAPVAARLNEAAPLRLDRLCLFRQAEPGAPFLRLHDEELPS
jgi:putative phosphonate metabolism protein